jgi:hypothetical protein
MLIIMLPFVLKVDRRNPRTQIGESLCQKILQHQQNGNNAISGRREEVACSVA